MGLGICLYIYFMGADGSPHSKWLLNELMTIAGNLGLKGPRLASADGQSGDRTWYMII